MKRLASLLPVFLAASLSGTNASAAEHRHHPHAGDISAYQGTKTCAECHEDAVKEVAVSLHYQHLGHAPNVEGWPAGKLAGMMSNY